MRRLSLFAHLFAILTLSMGCVALWILVFLM
jgi:hypothetical protein